ncbi:hypothetical protein ACJMK2_028502 [Sinanodonta woodiana]|uniref:Trafficking protein particle complex subunit 10 n=1 Tax=Sinanodonta woodiana TaxID=1069815 RepID=A0ABD3X993_SINWO
MESKPIVTYHGSQVLFSSLRSIVLQGLPKEPAEWRRSYGRAPKSVNLEASFVPYDEDILPEETDKTLVSRPYFHIFWTDCDLESYKQTVREEMAEWCSGLKNHNIPDWLIVVVVTDETKVKSKLLPRSSVIDKVRSDFCGKQPDRCFVLVEPLKSDPKSTESWNTFFLRLRQLLLQAFGRHLTKYEDNMRGLREKRNEAGWNFQEYFLVQEELGFMFEMMGLYDDALIQYDELDALFTQFVLNHASGVTVEWLATLVKPCTSWAGLSLVKPIDREKRDCVRDNKASLLEFRNYLFSRQCAILFLMNKPWEVVQRAIDFFHNTVQEMKALEVQIPLGGLDCWVFLSALEVLQHCQKHEESVQNKSYSLCTASLWDYACRKLRLLGELCGLMPNQTEQPSSEQLGRVIDLTSGMGIEEIDSAATQPRPRDKLREALSSRESFQKIYLELSELTMGTFKHIGRFRSARLLGKDLAHFYMQLGEPQKAENFLVDVEKSYHQEGWYQLAEATRLELANCQKYVGDVTRYVKTACQVAGSQTLKLSEREKHMTEVLQIADEHKADEPITLRASPLFFIIESSVQIKEEKVSLDEKVEVELVIQNNSPFSIFCNKIWLTLKSFKPDQNVMEKRAKVINQKISVFRTGSDSSLERQVTNFQPVRKQMPSLINLQASFEGTKKGIPSLCGITCVNTHELLKRADSAGQSVGKQEPVKLETSNTLCLENVKLHHADNRIRFMGQANEAGTFKLQQLGIKIQGLELLKDLDVENYITVDTEEPYCLIESEVILAGISQEVVVTLHTGSYSIPSTNKLVVRESPDITVDTGSHDNSVVLEKTPKEASTKFKMTIFMETRANGPEITENKIIFECDWLTRPLIAKVQFLHPFKIEHHLHTCKEKKFLQIQVSGSSEANFELTERNLIATNTADVDLVPLNSSHHKLRVNKHQQASCVWQIKPNVLHDIDLELEFHMKYRCLGVQIVNDFKKKQHVIHKFHLTHFQTLYTACLDVTPKSEDKVCEIGTMVCMKLHVKAMENNPASKDQSLIYEVSADQSMWGLYGKTTGTFNLKDGNYSTQMNVMPLLTGFLHYPKVTISKYDQNASEDVWVKNDKENQEQEKQDNSQDDFPESSTKVASSDVDNSSPNDDAPTQKRESKLSAIIPFKTGQVYYSSLGQQIQVYPENASTDLEVTVI